MAEQIERGQIWLFTFSRTDKRRPVLVLTRPEVIRLLDTVMVAPITSAIRGAPSEVIVGVDECGQLVNYFAVDTHYSRNDQLLTIPARIDPCRGQDFLQSLFSHLSATPRTLRHSCPESVRLYGNGHLAYSGT